jgi:hypothetical protein
MCFIDGLIPEIKSVVLVQHPQNLDTACVLALLQEEAMALGGVKQPRSGDWYSSSKFTKTPMPLPPPPRMDKPAVTPDIVHHTPATPAAASNDSKLQAVKAYRRAMGLCYKCGAKWSKDHKCHPEVLLAVEHLWDSYDASVDDLSENIESTPSATIAAAPEQVFVAISKAAALGSSAARTIRFVGSVSGIPALILVDSGSSTSFLSESLASRIDSAVFTQQSTQVPVAGGGLLHSSGILKDVPWTIDQYGFSSSF